MEKLYQKSPARSTSIYIRTINGVSDARDKAAVLTHAAGVALQDIRSIDYSWGEIDFEVHPMNRVCITGAPLPMEDSSYAMDIELDDIEVSEQ